MSLDIIVEKYSYSIPRELVTAAVAEAVHDGLAKGAYWMMFTVIGVVVGSLLVRIFVPNKAVRQTEPVEPAQLQLVQSPQPEQFPQSVEPQLFQPQQPAQNEQIDEANEQRQLIHRYNLRGRQPQPQPQPRRQSRGRSRGQSRSPPLDRQVQQDQSDDEQPTLYVDDNRHGGWERISAGSYPADTKKLVLKRNSYSHATAEFYR